MGQKKRARGVARGTKRAKRKPSARGNYSPGNNRNRPRAPEPQRVWITLAIREISIALFGDRGPEFRNANEQVAARWIRSGKLPARKSIDRPREWDVDREILLDLATLHGGALRRRDLRPAPVEPGVLELSLAADDQQGITRHSADHHFARHALNGHSGE